MRICKTLGLTLCAFLLSGCFIVNEHSSFASVGETRDEYVSRINAENAEANTRSNTSNGTTTNSNLVDF